LTPLPPPLEPPPPFLPFEDFGGEAPKALPQHHPYMPYMPRPAGAERGGGGGVGASAGGVGSDAGAESSERLYFSGFRDGVGGEVAGFRGDALGSLEGSYTACARKDVCPVASWMPNEAQVRKRGRASGL